MASEKPEVREQDIPPESDEQHVESVAGDSQRREAAWTGAIVAGAMGVLYGPALVGSSVGGYLLAVCLAAAGYFVGRRLCDRSQDESTGS